MLQWSLPYLRLKRTWFFLFLVAILISIAAYFVRAEYQLRLARSAVERRAYAEAQEHLAQYQRVWPRSPSALLLAARCARGLGNFDEAERLLAACPGRGTDSEAVALESLLLDAQRGTLDPAGEELLWRRAKQEDPETARILEALALGCIYTQRPGDAMACLERWLAYAPGDSQALYLRGLVWEGMGALQKAGEDYRQAVRHDPDHLPARQRLAEYLLSVGEHQEAAVLFEQLLQRQPHDAANVLGLAKCRRLQGDIAEAERLLNDLLIDDSAYTPALIERANLALDQSEFDGAERWFRQALDQDPFDRDACYGLARCLRALGRSPEAEVYEARRAQIDRDLERLAGLCEEMGKNPSDADLPYQAGMICQRNAQKAEARRWFRHALQLSPRHEGARRALEELSKR